MHNETYEPLVSVIVPTYKRKNKLLNCINSIIGNTYENIEIIVINDDPSEDISEFLKIYQVILVQNKKENLAAGCRNLGAQIAKGDILFFVDDDNILRENTILQLVKTYLLLDKPGFIGPVMYNSNGEIWFYGARTNWISIMPKPVDISELKKDLIETDVIPNAYLVSAELYRNIGMEDESLAIFHEEFDLAIRLKLSGYKSYITTKAVITHDYGSLDQHLDSMRIYINFRNILLVERRYAPRPRFILFCFNYIRFSLYYFMYKIPVRLKGETKITYYKSCIRGIAEGLFSNPFAK